MKKLSSYINRFYIFAIGTALACASCTDDNTAVRGGSGYVQFKVYKSAPENQDPASRAGNNQLDYLNDAKKIKVMLSNEEFNFAQTLNLNAYNETTAEYGLRSDKLELQPGEYTVGGFYLYDKTETQIFAGQMTEKTTFTVKEGELYVQDLMADVVARGTVRFTLVKNLLKSRAATADTKTYPFSDINKVDITVQNVDTREKRTLSSLEVEYVEDFAGDGDGRRTSVGKIDSLVSMEAGTYKILSYVAYNRTTPLEYFSDKVLEETAFTVADNKTVETDVPVNLVESAANILDYIALKAIWDKMDGPNWSYGGESYPKGINWNFNKDIDLWGEQPGVVLDNNGRVASLNLGEFRAKGIVPEEIGALTALQTLALGTHNDLLGYVPGEEQSALTSLKGELTPEKLAAIRADYMDHYVAHDIREDLSEPLQLAMEIKGDYTRAAHRNGGAGARDINWGNLTNGITGIHPAIGNLKNLEVVYIANAPIEKLPEAEGEYEGFAGLTKLTDLEIYNCPNMKEFPMVLGQLPELIQLNMAMNKQMSGSEFKKGIQALIDRNGNPEQDKQTIQILYLGYNNIEELPADICKMTKLGKIDLIKNKLTELPAFGQDVNLVQANFDYNQISKIGTMANDAGKQIFCGMDDVETISFAHNKLTTLPDIFDVKSIYIMASVSFAYNEITDEGLNQTEGINTTNLSLAGNKLTKFPKKLISSGSPLTVLNLSANRISEFKKGDLEGKNAYMLTTLDLTYNRLKELPADFDGKTLPYLYGLDMSGNQLNGFPWGALNISYLTVLSLRNQRDDNGNRTMSEWPEGVAQHKGLRALFLGGNDLGKIPETEKISYLIYTLDVSDNPNLILNVSSVCPYIKAGLYTLIYDRTQDIRGCDALELD